MPVAVSAVKANNLSGSEMTAIRDTSWIKRSYPDLAYAPLSPAQMLDLYLPLCVGDDPGRSVVAGILEYFGEVLLHDRDARGALENLRSDVLPLFADGEQEMLCANALMAELLRALRG